MNSGPVLCMHQFYKSVNFTGTDDMARDVNPASKWRQHISPPSHVNRTSHSPVRTRHDPSPSSKGDNSYHPTPTPRKHVDHGVSVLPVSKFGQKTADVALTSQDTAPNRVSRVRDQFEQNPHRKTSDGNVRPPLKTKSKSPSPSPSRVPERRSPVPLRKHEDKSSHEENVYSMIWEKNSGKPSLDVPDSGEIERPVSVFERSKMFENVNSDNKSDLLVSPSPSKPVKPPPPVRQRSISGDSDIKTNSHGKPLPPRPPMRQRSLTEKANANDTNSELIENLVSAPKVTSKPPPPVKPPRTGAHDDYVKVKLENDTKDARVKLHETQNENFDTQTEDTNNMQRVLPKIPVTQKKRPTRPPPPRKKKPRPFSIATETATDFRSSDGSDSDEINKSKDDNLFYEMIPVEAFRKQDRKEPLKHWDLPRASHPEPIRRSLSAECIQKAVDDKGMFDVSFSVLSRLLEKQCGN